MPRSLKLLLVHAQAEPIARSRGEPHILVQSRDEELYLFTPIYSIPHPHFLWS